MSSPATHTSTSNGTTSAQDLFALTDEQILQIEPDAQDVEVFLGERSDTMDPLRADMDLLATPAAPAVASPAAKNEKNSAAPTTQSAAVSSTKDTANDAAPAWLAERMNDPQQGAEARELWQSVQAARQEASAFREVFAKPEEARAAAERARTLDDFDRAYFGAAGSAPEQLSAARAELASKLFRDDPAAFREMVFAGLRALETAGQQGTSTSDASAAPPLSAASSAPAQGSAAQQNPKGQPNAASSQQETHGPQDTQLHEARVAAYATFERATNADLEHNVGGAIDRSLQAALPNAARSESGAALKERLSAAIRQDVEKSLQGDRALGEQVARILSGKRLDDTTRAQVVRLIGDRAQQLVPGAARKVLSDWTQTTLSARGAGAPSGEAQRPPVAASAQRAAHSSSARDAQPQTSRSALTSRDPRKIDYRRISDDDILDS